MKMKKIILIFFGVSLITNNAFSIEKIREVKYNPNDIINITAKESLLTIVEFDDDEKVIDGNAGFNQGWVIKKSGNIAYITPKPYLASIAVSEDGETIPRKGIIYPNVKDWKTNFFIRTNKRLYIGDLELSNTRSNYKIKMKYPKEDWKKKKEEWTKKKKKMSKDKILKDLNKIAVPRNWNYYKKVNKRSEDIVPNYVYDDGKFTYFGFDRTKKMPTIFIREDQDELSTNSHTRRIGRYYVKVVHKTGKIFFLRSGKKLVGILNNGYGVNPNYEYDTTSSRKVKRVIKK